MARSYFWLYGSSLVCIRINAVKGFKQKEKTHYDFEPKLHNFYLKGYFNRSADDSKLSQMISTEQAFLCLCLVKELRWNQL
jgi:hypothetical protein